MRVTATASVQTGISCFGGNDGVIVGGLVGGITPYTYNWSNSQTSMNSTGLVAGNYSVTIDDAGGCSDVASITMTEPTDLISTSSMISSISCFGGNDGAADVVGSGGTTPYTYLWSNGVTNASTSAIIAGNYSVTITDVNGCIKSSSVTITEPSQLSITSGVVTSVTCNGGNDGSANTLAIGGTAPYAYAWSNGYPDTLANGLFAGIYTIVATDAMNCSISSSVTISQPSALSVTSSAAGSSCGLANGGASVVVSGGTSGYTYAWNTGSTVNSISNVGSGTYYVTATDANGCVKEQIVFVGDNDGPALSLSMLAESNCGGADGVITSNVSGGTSPYSYIWSNGVIGTENYSAAAGQISLAVTDAIGCVGLADLTVTSQGVTAPSISGNVTSMVTGFTITSGSVTIFTDDPYATALLPLAVAPIDSLGNYWFPAISPIGDYLLLAEADTSIQAFGGNIPTFYNGTHMWDSAEVVTTLCDSAFNVDMQLIFLDSLTGTSTLGGIIAFDGSNKHGSRAGDPIPGVDISLEQIPGGIIATTQTDSTGEYSFENVPVSDSSYDICKLSRFTDGGQLCCRCGVRYYCSRLGLCCR